VQIPVLFKGEKSILLKKEEKKKKEKEKNWLSFQYNQDFEKNDT
jgi:hypothetical protein